MRNKKLLLTTDLSDEALRPLAGLRELAEGRGLAITLLHVVPVLAVAPPGGPRAPAIRPADLEGEKTRARAALESIKKQLAGLDVTVDVVDAQDVAAAICAYAEEKGMDLIAMSTHGRTGFRRLMLGSVAEHVLRHSPVPVLVYPRKE
ncbi:MAG: universal stress protein [Planctomycetota bacterium]